METRAGRIVVGVILISLILCVKFIIAVPLLYIQGVRAQIRSDLHNPIISGRFAGWHKEQLHRDIKWSTLKLPGDWRLETEAQLAIYDGTGKQIAFGESCVFEYDPPDDSDGLLFPPGYRPSDEELQRKTRQVIAEIEAGPAPVTFSEEDICRIVSNHYGSEVDSDVWIGSQHIFEGSDDWYEYDFFLESGETVRLLCIVFENAPKDRNEVIYDVLFFEDPDDALRETATAIIYSSANNVWTIFW